VSADGSEVAFARNAGSGRVERQVGQDAGVEVAGHGDRRMAQKIPSGFCLDWK
jgi:hypothetical protein